ncbi:hypothetical protein [Kribbella deserti]|uniref:DUF5668 domain-containing protein n=1 Tax=Kribbella deserti TaxID=1926257 RepID=A0ABV6QWU3_9ACTN
MTAPVVPRWRQAGRVIGVVFTVVVILLQIVLLVQNDRPRWWIAWPVALLILFAGLLWWSRGQFRGASKDHPIEARSRRGLAMSVTWLLILTGLMIRSANFGGSWLLLGVYAIGVLFTIGAVAEAAMIAPRDERGEQAPDGPAEDLPAP